MSLKTKHIRVSPEMHETLMHDKASLKMTSVEDVIAFFRESALEKV
tara:strand:+ start:13192 stop:13329 length:138 start_codon:yes stop_codon:yes gene_type:complete